MSNVRTIEAALQEIRAASTASGGTALTDTLGLISLPIGSDWLSITPRNFVGAAVARFAVNPWLTIIKTADLLVSEGTDLSVEAQDGDTTAMSFASMDTLANGDALYVGSWLPFRGVQIDMAAAVNGDASVILVEYWNGGGWTDISATDGTDTAGASLAKDGNVDWTVPSAWAKSSLHSNAAVSASNAVFNSWATRSPYGASLYWTRWSWGTVLDASVDVNQIRTLNRSTAYAELTEGQPFAESFPSPVGAGNSFACVEALTNAGIGNLIVNVATRYSAERGAF